MFLLIPCLHLLLVVPHGVQSHTALCDASDANSDSKGNALIQMRRGVFAGKVEEETQPASPPPETCSSSGFGLQARVFPVGESRSPPNPALRFTSGPGDFPFWSPKQFYPVARGGGQEGVLWPDSNDNVVYVTWFARDLSSAETSAIYMPSEHEKLYSASSNGDDAIMLLTVDDGQSQSSKTEPAQVRMIKIDSSNGFELKKRLLQDVNLWKYSIGGSMAWDRNTDTIAIMISTFMTQTGDGLNHQSCLAVLVNGSSLEMKKNFGQTSSHSVDNTIVKVGGDDEFLGMDLADVFRRGINLHRMTGSWMMSQVVYAMKNTKKDDLYVYTEIGHPGVVEVDDGFLIFFAGEQPPLDSTMVGSVLNAPRDLGFVKISKTTREILSSGAEETGGYYNYAGEWTAHTNIGITFLTHQKSMEESVSRIKTFSLNSSRILLAYEIWTAKSYVATEFMVIDADGGIVQSPWRACFPMRTIKADDGMVVGGRAVMYAGGLDNTLHRYEVCVDGSCESGGSSQVPVPPAPSPPYFTRKGLSDIAPEDCVDKNIRACNKDMCTGDYWYKYVLNNCPRMCGFCAPLETTAPPTVPPTTPPTTPSIAPEDCVDTGSCNQGMCTSDFWRQ